TIMIVSVRCIVILFFCHVICFFFFFFFSSRRRHTRSYGDWSSDVCSSDLIVWRDRRGKEWGSSSGYGGRGPETSRRNVVGRWERSEERRVGKEGRGRRGRDE